ncbi:DUF6327 family protein [Candidatus Ulvibacter alkanivorans]|uniref:DUF6327 family protein n=1 Tax=Candidatus Ulvibacter alkanivorans TaxID=2267620 RepID=UPI000DF34401|nr:DUF6327 family protein [Candidatus Ulvibacter alkanivorans]
MKQYSTFKEIDRDLKYLKLKSQIDLEEFKLGVHNTKESFRESMSPWNLIANAVGAVAKKALVLKAVDMLLGIKKVKEVDEKEE